MAYFCPFNGVNRECKPECMLWVPESNGYPNPFNNRPWSGCSFNLTMMQMVKIQKNVSTLLANLESKTGV